jgi:hypothetical protein
VESGGCVVCEIVGGAVFEAEVAVGKVVGVDAAEVFAATRTKECENRGNICKKERKGTYTASKSISSSIIRGAPSEPRVMNAVTIPNPLAVLIDAVIYPYCIHLLVATLAPSPSGLPYAFKSGRRKTFRIKRELFRYAWSGWNMLIHSAVNGSPSQSAALISLVLSESKSSV